MGRKSIDLTGQRFGRLVIVKERGERVKKGAAWECKCDCGNTVIVLGSNLRNGSTSSCGCYRTEVNKAKDAPQLTEALKRLSLREGTSLFQITSDNIASNTSGVKGVSWSKSRAVWLARLTFKGQLMLNKGFANKQDAINARKAAEEKYFKPILEKYGKEI